MRFMLQIFLHIFQFMFGRVTLFQVMSYNRFWFCIGFSPVNRVWYSPLQAFAIHPAVFHVINFRKNVAALINTANLI